MSKAPSKEFVARSRDFRDPVDSSKEAQRLFDGVLRRMGIKALRSNSIFVTTDRVHAGSYGQLYIIFPIDGFAFSYTKHNDLVLHGIEDVVDQRVLQKIALEIEKKEILLADYGLERIDDKVHIHTEDPWKFVAKLKTNEILDAIPFIKNLTVDQLVTPADIEKRFEVKQTNIQAALKNQIEVCVNGSYYAFEYDKYHELIAEQLGFPI